MKLWKRMSGYFLYFAIAVIAPWIVTAQDTEEIDAASCPQSIEGRKVKFSLLNKNDDNDDDYDDAQDCQCSILTSCTVPVSFKIPGQDPMIFPNKNCPENIPKAEIVTVTISAENIRIMDIAVPVVKALFMFASNTSGDSISVQCKRVHIIKDDDSSEITTTEPPRIRSSTQEMEDGADDEENGSTVTVVLAVILGLLAVVVLVFVIVAVILVRRRKKRKQNVSGDDDPAMSDPHYHDPAMRTDSATSGVYHMIQESKMIRSIKKRLSSSTSDKASNGLRDEGAVVICHDIDETKTPEMKRQASVTYYEIPEEGGEARPISGDPPQNGSTSTGDSGVGALTISGDSQQNGGTSPEDSGEGDLTDNGYTKPEHVDRTGVSAPYTGLNNTVDGDYVAVFIQNKDEPNNEEDEAQKTNLTSKLSTVSRVEMVDNDAYVSDQSVSEQGDNEEDVFGQEDPTIMVENDDYMSAASEDIMAKSEDIVQTDTRRGNPTIDGYETVQPKLDTDAESTGKMDEAVIKKDIQQKVESEQLNTRIDGYETVVIDGESKAEEIQNEQEIPVYAVVNKKTKDTMDDGDEGLIIKENSVYNKNI